jgi:hypothetical protein
MSTKKPRSVTEFKTETNNETKTGLASWLNSLYTEHPNDSELLEVYDAVKYKGFNREEILERLSIMVPDVRIMMQLIVLCAVCGPNKASQTIIPATRKTPIAMGISGSGQKGTKNLSCSRITSTTADLAAYYLKRLNVPKRMNLQCPGWLQFPAAGSIRLPPDLRTQHREFAKKFSEVIKGEFNEDIYNQMEMNAYYDERLNLF